MPGNLYYFNPINKQLSKFSLNPCKYPETNVSPKILETQPTFL